MPLSLAEQNFRKKKILILSGVFLLSFSLLSLEVSLTRVLSVVLSYHFVFVVISVALLGISGGALFLQLFRPELPKERNIFVLFLFSFLFSLSTFLCLLSLLWISNHEKFTGKVLIYSLILLLPFFFAGAFLSEVFRSFPRESSRIYFADLIGASLGAVATIPLLNLWGGMNNCFFLSIVLLIASSLFLFAQKSKEQRVLVVFSSLVTVLVALFLLGELKGWIGLDIPIGKNPEKQSYVALKTSSARGKIIETKWSAYGRTDLVSFERNPEVMVIYIDGTAGSPMLRFSGNLEDPGPIIEGLKYSTPGYFPFFFLREGEKDEALIIGPGGGRDILLSLLGGVSRVEAVEINKSLVEIVSRYSWFNGGIYSDFENVKIKVDEGRNFLRTKGKKYDLIILQFPYTETSHSLEGYSLTENFLFTTDSIEDYLNHLTREGRLVVACERHIEVQRLVTLSLVVLRKKGIEIEEGMKRIYTLGSQKKKYLFVLKKESFKRGEVLRRYRAMIELGYEPEFSYFPYLKENLNEELKALEEGRISLEEFIKLSLKRGSTISPVSDNNPFFFKLDKGIPKPILLILHSALGGVFLATLLPLLFLRRSLNFWERSIIFKFPFLYALLGLGFMLVEISLIQRFSLFLGHPVLSLSLLLFSILTGASVGSLKSGSISGDKIQKGISRSCLLVSILLFSYVILIPFLFGKLQGQSLMLRLSVSFLICGVLGFLMGFPFPLGIRLLKEKKGEMLIPWMWAINGGSSVLGSVVTVIIAISFGFNEVLLLGSFCYLLSFLIFYS